MIFVPVPTAHPQLAFGLGRRFGTAVERNRARRRLRAAFHSALSEPGQPVPLGAYLMSADRAALVAPFPTLVTSVGRCLNQVGDRVGATGNQAGSPHRSTAGDGLSTVWSTGSGGSR